MSFNYYQGYQDGQNSAAQQKQAEEAGKGAGILIVIALLAVVLAIAFPLATVLAGIVFSAISVIASAIAPALFNGLQWFDFLPSHFPGGPYRANWPGVIAGGLLGLAAFAYGLKLEFGLSESSFYYVFRHIWRLFGFGAIAAAGLIAARNAGHITDIAVIAGGVVALGVLHAIFWYAVRPHEVDA